MYEAVLTQLVAARLRVRARVRVKVRVMVRVSEVVFARLLPAAQLGLGQS